MALNYKLRNPKAEKSSIFIRYYINSVEKKYGTGITIPVELWNGENQTIKTDKRILSRLYSKEFSPSTQHSDDVVKLEDARTDINIYKTKLKGRPQVWSEIKLILDKIFKAEKFTDDTVKSDSIAEFTTNWISGVIDNGYGYEGKQYSRSTIKTYSEFATIISGYEKKKRRKLLFAQMDKTEYREINNYLKNKLEYKVNTVGKFFKNLKSIMNIAYEEEAHSNLFHRSRAYKVIKEESKNIYLSHTELLQLARFNDLSDTQKLYRDLFLIGCSTMQRFSDYSRICNDDIVYKNDQYYWIMEQRKTDEPLEIELSEPCVRILEKYDFNILDKFPNGKAVGPTMNSYIKIIARNAGITETKIGSSKKNGLKETTRIDKCNLITSHTCRRTGATLAYLDGMSLIDICAVTGHASIASLEVYIKPTIEDKRKRTERMKRVSTDNVVQIRKAI